MPNYQSSRRLPGTVPRLQNWALGAVALVSFLLLVQNFGLNILPSRVVEIAPDRIYPLPPEPSHAYFFPYAASEASEWLNPWSRVVVSENGQAYSGGMQGIESIRNVGGGRWTHEQGRIVFSTTPTPDPRQNGRRYSLVSPLLYRRQIADFALCAFIGATMGLYRINRRPVAPFIPPTTPSARWRWHLAGASALFILGLYCNTGTLSPYAVTSWPKVDTATGYLYNTDHPHFRVLFDFVDGESRSVWDHALFLRRILFPVLGWPLMKLWGFEVGGTIAAVMLNVSGLVAALVLLRRRIGEKGAIFAAWILAIYPGAAYWGGLPYPYALIFPRACS